MLFKNFILYLLFALLPLAAGAQNYFATGEDGTSRLFYGGFAAGFNFSQVDGDSYAGYHKVGFNGGGLVYVRFSDRVGISLELAYSQKGARVKENATDIYGVPYLNDYKLKLNYAEVPLLFYIVADENSKVHFKAGLSYARLVNSSEVAIANYPVNIDPSLYPFKKQDIAYIGEINYMFYRSWFISFRYSYSVNSVRSAQYIPPGYGQGKSGQYNNCFSLRLMRLVK